MKTPNATRMKLFYLSNFEVTFERWVAEIEKDGRELRITAEEPLLNAGSTVGFMIWYLVWPRTQKETDP